MLKGTERVDRRRRILCYRAVEKRTEPFLARLAFTDRLTVALDTYPRPPRSPPTRCVLRHVTDTNPTPTPQLRTTTG